MANAARRDSTRAENRIERPPLRAWVGVLGGMTSLGVVAFNDHVWQRWQERVPWLPRWAYQAGFAAAAAEHVRKAARANTLARQAGMAPVAPAWTRQTLLLGFPSLRRLERITSVRDAPSPD
jgi:hypothetical protein